MISTYLEKQTSKYGQNSKKVAWVVTSLVVSTTSLNQLGKAPNEKKVFCCLSVDVWISSDASHSFSSSCHGANLTRCLGSCRDRIPAVVPGASCSMYVHSVVLNKYQPKFMKAHIFCYIRRHTLEKHFYLIIISFWIKYDLLLTLLVLENFSTLVYWGGRG